MSALSTFSVYAIVYLLPAFVGFALIYAAAIDIVAFGRKFLTRIRG